jgi:CheY-like chemotaxis protein
MTEQAELNEKPIALLVEDNRDLLDARRDQCRIIGYQSIAVDTYQDALREFFSTPAIDLVITDVNLNPKDPDDRSGIELAKTIKRHRPDVHVVGYSAVLDETDLEDQRSFSATAIKGDIYEKTFQLLKDYKEQALASRRARVEQAKKTVDDLHRAYKSIRPGETNTGPEPAGTAAARGDSSGDEKDWGDEPIRSEKFGYHPDSVPAGYGVAEESGRITRTVKPIPLWLLQEENYFVAELMDHPRLYAESDTRDGAIRGLILLMHGYHRDFELRDYRPFGPSLGQLRKYLKEIFG